MKRLLVLAALVVAAASVMIVPATASAGADVVNGIGCAFLSPTTGLVYEGVGTIINGESQSMARCSADLVDGQTPVTETTRTTYAWGSLECTAVETTSGKAHFTCVGDAP